MGFWPIYKRETKAYATAPSTHAVLCMFSVLSGYFFYTNLIQFNWYNTGGTASLVRGLWQYYFNDVRFILIFMLPLLTMRLFAEEKKLGTIELLATYPIRDLELITGKYLACMTVFLVMLGLSFLNVLLLGSIWDFGEILPVMSGYTGIFLLGCALISLGLFVSSLTDNQVVAAMGSMGAFIFLWFLTWNEMVGEEALMSVLKRVSLFDRVFDFFLGVINTRDIVFFVLMIGYFIFLTHLSLGSRSWRGIK